MAARRPPPEPDSPSIESVETLLTSPPVSRFVDSRIREAVRRWSGRLRPEDLAAIRARADLEISLDPVLRGLLTRFARAFAGHRR